MITGDFKTENVNKSMRDYILSKGGGIKRLGNVDIMRFIAITLIMTHHLYHIDVEGNYPFKGAWIYVELFFIITGYFTMKHFSGLKQEERSAQYARTAINYTIGKFKKFMPYIIIAVSMEYFFQGYYLLKSGQLKVFVLNSIDLPFELMLLHSSGFGHAKLVPIWYLSAMFLVMPLLCYVIQRCNGIFAYILCWLIPVLYYGKNGVFGAVGWPHDMLRAFACLSLGCFVYMMAEMISTKSWSKYMKYLFTIVEFICFVTPIIITSQNWVMGDKVLLAFTLQSIIMFSECSYSSNIALGEILVHLGKITMPIYLFHWAIGSFTMIITEIIALRILLYYSLTMIISVMVYFFVEKIKAMNILEKIIYD